MSPKARQTVYAVGTIATSIVTVLALWNGIRPEVASSLVTAITALGGLLGAGAAATATAVVTRQQRNGTFENMSPVDQAITGIQTTVDQFNSATTDFERIKAAASDVFGNIPVIGPLAQQVIDSAKLP